MKLHDLSRRDAIRILGLGIVTSGLTSNLSCSSKKNSHPNIVFILADDMGYGDLACQNSESKVPTPNLDRLAIDGIRLTDAHSPSAVCTPTRYGLLTGRYCWRSRLKNNVLWCWDKPLIEDDRLTVGALLKLHGYDTACIGKWHLGWDWPTKDGEPPVGIGQCNHPESGSNVDFTKPIENGPTSRGFDYYFGTAVPNFPPYCFIENEHTVGIPSIMKPDSMFGCTGPMITGWDLEDILPSMTQKAVEYIDDKGGHTPNPIFRQTEGEPFFLYMPLTAPHTPIAPDDEFKSKSDAGAYGDFVYQVDHVVGQIRDALERNGFINDTLIIFSSDNGSPRRDGTNMNGPVNSVLKYGHNPSYIFRGIKADIWDGGHRIPFIAFWKNRISPGTVSDEPICLTDFMATISALLGSDIPEDAAEDSYNILHVLTGTSSSVPVHEAIIHHSINGMFAIRTKKWKLIEGEGSGGWSAIETEKNQTVQLYDMEHDPEEQYNVYQEHPEVVSYLKNLLKQYKESGRSAPRK